MGGLMPRHIYIVLLCFILTSTSSSFLFGWWLVSKWEKIERGGLPPGHMTVLNGEWSLWDGRREEYLVSYVLRVANKRERERKVCTNLTKWGYNGRCASRHHKIVPCLAKSERNPIPYSIPDLGKECGAGLLWKWTCFLIYHPSPGLYLIGLLHQDQ